MVVIGLTGPTGAGKSTVRELFASYGIPGIDADSVYRELIAPPSPCLDELTRIFGNSILLPDGSLDRRTLGKKVFSNAGSRAMLNAVSHRYVMKEIRRRLADLEKNGANMRFGKLGALCGELQNAAAQFARECTAKAGEFRKF